MKGFLVERQLSFVISSVVSRWQTVNRLEGQENEAKIAFANEVIENKIIKILKVIFMKPTH